MLILKLELHSAFTGKVTTLGKMMICNDGTGSHKRGNYLAQVQGKTPRSKRQGQVQDFPRLSYSPWRLVIRALLSAYPEERK